MRQFDLVIFDCDGVLIDSEAIALPVLRSMLAALGATLDLEQMHHRFGGLSLPHLFDSVTELLEAPPPATFLDDFNRRTEAALQTRLAPIPGVPHLLEHLTHPFCVASNAESHEVLANLATAGLLHHFEDRIFTATNVQHPKPAPDLYLLAARTLGAAPERCAVIEDSPTGVTAGAAAGMHVFGYTSAHPAQRLLDAGARQTFTHMDQLTALLGA